jgi:hypothetical protein
MIERAAGALGKHCPTSIRRKDDAPAFARNAQFIAKSSAMAWERRWKSRRSRRGLAGAPQPSAEYEIEATQDY